MHDVQSSERVKYHAAIDALEDNNPGTDVLTFEWTTNGTAVHGCTTTKMQGYKLVCSKDSFAGGALKVGLCACTGKKIHPPPLVKVAFSKEPITSDLIAALRQAVDGAA